MFKLLILFTAFALVYGNVVSKTARLGALNRYFFYDKNDPLQIPVEIPADISAAKLARASKVIGISNINDEVEETEEVIDPEGSNEEEENVDDDHPLSIDNGKPTMVIVHGHGGTGFSTLNPTVKNELFKGGHDHNVIVVDWSFYTQQNYAIAVNAVPSVGTSLGIFLKGLVDQRRINATITHLVGFNLGAHVVGFAARILDSKPARITGLDPSKNQWGSGTLRLSEGDATYVEVIHTDGDGIFANGIGTPIGNVDFFVNGGGNQPGCLTHQCSHNRAYEVFAATLSRATQLIGNRCTSNLQVSLNTCRGVTNYIGGTEFVKYEVDGRYRVNTKKSFPF